MRVISIDSIWTLVEIIFNVFNTFRHHWQWDEIFSITFMTVRSASFLSFFYRFKNAFCLPIYDCNKTDKDTFTVYQCDRNQHFYCIAFILHFAFCHGLKNIKPPTWVRVHTHPFNLSLFTALLDYFLFHRRTSLFSNINCWCLCWIQLFVCFCFLVYVLCFFFASTCAYSNDARSTELRYTSNLNKCRVFIYFSCIVWNPTH